MSVGFAEAKKEQAGPDRYVSTVAIIAGIFAAIRLARVPDMELNGRRVADTVKQGVLFARAVLAEAMRFTGERSQRRSHTHVLVKIRR